MSQTLEWYEKRYYSAAVMIGIICSNPDLKNKTVL